MTDVGAMVRTHRRRLFKSRQQAAEVLSITREGLRRIEVNLNLPSADVLNLIISKWGLDLAEAEMLRRAVFMQRQLRDGYVQPTTIDPLGDDVESLIHSTLGEIVREMKQVLKRTSNEEEVLLELHTVCERCLRASFR
jgi:hypothetical protein